MTAEPATPVADPRIHEELDRLRRENRRLTEQLESAEASLVLQSKALRILGALTDEDRVNVG